MRLPRSTRSRMIAVSTAVVGALLGARPLVAAVPSELAPRGVSETRSSPIAARSARAAA